MSSVTVPTINISKLDLDTPEFVTEFGAAFQEWGFVGITGHEIEQSVILKAMDSAEWFFNLPMSEKRQYQQKKSWARGYVPLGTETAKGSKYSDLKEFYHLGRDNAGEHGLEGNVWPDHPGFVSSFKRLHQELDKLSVKVLRAMAMYLGLDSEFFSEKIASGEALLRVLHYPPITDPQAPNVRAAAHEDINLITLLVGSEQEGLEVLSRRGQWVPITMIEGTIICNLGDMMQRLTNGKLPSTTHRVVNPKGVRARQSRYSVPFFVHPDPAMSLACLPQCCDDNNPKQYQDLSAGDYHQQRLREIGFK